MADITKCHGEGCESREECRRFRANADTLHQSWAVFEQGLAGDKCEHFMEIEPCPST